jgi:hypothetical protein
MKKQQRMKSNISQESYSSIPILLSRNIRYVYSSVTKQLTCFVENLQ